MRKPPTTAGAVDGRALRAGWDAACEEGANVLLRYRDLARERDEPWVAKYLTTAVSQLEFLRRTVDARFNRPGTHAPGLIVDAPIQLWHDPYKEAGATLAALTDLYAENGLGAPDWDWSRGYPPGWPTSLRDRLRAYAPFTVR